MVLRTNTNAGSIDQWRGFEFHLNTGGMANLLSIPRLEEAGCKVDYSTDGEWTVKLPSGEVLVFKRDTGVCNRMPYITSSGVSARFNNYFRDGFLMRVRRPSLAVGSARSSSGKPQNVLIGISSYYSGLPRLSCHGEVQTNHGASYGRLWGVVPRNQDVWSESTVLMHLSNSLPPAVSARRLPRWQNIPYSRDCGEGK
ncbi:hypothetical protein THAOC_17605 [Thalassiosira oceanica]|uniref:Uncharacterized protein n=1 Tax=Thalassiosira oceanica TaxID=159749 RepID=K0S6W3_THAOC|nr:hypothetical protein THAOC_17605 [Thalassiosira oceanica]|eukprot:EJK61833.1 hypothetical protein THAOC_17605 [Thalassiosira oceanica]